MEYIPQSKAQRFDKGAVTSWEYAMEHATLNVAPISIAAKYPETGYTSNTLSDAIVHVIDGSGMLALHDGTTVELKKNDQVHLAVGDEYYFDGELEILYTATPAWSPEQALQVN